MKKKICKSISFFFLLFTLLYVNTATANEAEGKTLVYIFDIKEQIAKPVWRTTQKAFENAKEQGADIVLVHMNTYGGLVNMADSIRTKILNSPVPVYVFIDDNAASAGALISIACDSIYMKPGAKIGAATVVNQSGEQVPDKYQSYMRATMRATAEAHGKDTIISNGDTSYVWHRDPKIAEAMVDPSMFVPGISDSGKVLTFTAEEAVRYGYCEGIAINISQVLEKAGIEDYKTVTFTPTAVDKIISLLLSPFVQGILIMIIIGGLYFELQTPGIGFPLGASALAAILYFAPLYLEGLADNWEMIIFVAGIALIAVEIFAIPGFGVAGTTGIVLAVGGLTMAMVDNVVFDTGDITLVMNTIMRALVIVLLSLISSLVLSIWMGKKLVTSRFFPNLALNDSQTVDLGFLGVDSMLKNLVGKEGTAYTVLRPSGKVEIDGDVYDAKSEYGYIARGNRIKVLRYGSGQLYVEEIEP